MPHTGGIKTCYAIKTSLIANDDIIPFALGKFRPNQQLNMLSISEKMKNNMSWDREKEWRKEYMVIFFISINMFIKMDTHFKLCLHS